MKTKVNIKRLDSSIHFKASTSVGPYVGGRLMSGRLEEDTFEVPKHHSIIADKVFSLNDEEQGIQVATGYMDGVLHICYISESDLHKTIEDMIR